MKKLVSYKNSKIYYYVEGEAEKAVLFIHGDGQNHSAGKAYLEIFPKDYKKISLDLPGHGSSEDFEGRTLISESEIIKKIFREEKVNSAIIIGHSHGASLAYYLASKISVISLVLFDPLLADPKILFSKELIEQLESSFLEQIEGLYDKNLQYHFFGSEKSDQEISLFSAKHTSPKTLRRNLRVLESIDLKDFEVSIPILIFQSDEESPISTRDSVLAFSEGKKNVKINTVSSSSHNFHILCKEKIKKIIKENFAYLRA